MKYLIVLLILFNIADGIVTYFLVKHGVGKEVNPFLQQLVDQPTFMIIKVVGVVLCALILWDVYRRHPRLALVSTSCFVISYAVVVLWNSSLFLL